MKYTPTTFLKRCYVSKVLISGNAWKSKFECNNRPVNYILMALVLLKLLPKILRHIMVTLALQLQLPTV